MQSKWYITVSILAGRSLTRNSKCWLPVDLLVSRHGNTSFLPSIDRILSWKGDTKERITKKWKKWQATKEYFQDYKRLLAPLVLTRKTAIRFFCCIAELAIKPCRSSRSKLRGEFGIPKHLQNRKQKHKKATNTPNPTHNTKQKQHGKCLEGETRGEKRVKRPKRPNALICRTPGGSIRYPLSCSFGMTLISHSIV